MSSNNFLQIMKPVFDFLIKDRGYTLVYKEASSAFNDGSLIYESPVLHVHIFRDRGQAFATVRAHGDWRDFDDEILRLLLANKQEYRPAPNEFTAEALGTFFQANLSAIETLFQPERRESTIATGERLKKERAETLFREAGDS